jgi:hypothetical protein
MIGITTYISVKILNVNGLNLPIKGIDYRIKLKKQDPTIYCLQGMHFTGKEKHRLKVKGGKRFSEQIDNRSIYTHI